MNTNQQQTNAERVQSVIVPWQPPVEPLVDRPADDNVWPEPQPLTVKMGFVPYPLDALPAKIRAAVDEVQGFSKAPTPMIAECVQRT